MSLPNTKWGAARIAALLQGKSKLFFVGIGGVHMASMAELAYTKGYEVAGSDRVASAATAHLAALGIPVWQGHDAAHVVGYDAVIYTLAVSAENPEYAAALRLGIPVISRADFLSFLMLEHPCRIGVAGCHGKSTVTAMLAEILHRAGHSPTVFCGASLKDGSGMRVGTGREALFEACEYQDSFLRFSPTLAILLNVEWDHVDWFPDVAAVRRSFAAFAALPGVGGTALYNGEDENCVKCVAESLAAKISFGVENGDFHTRLQGYHDGCAEFAPVLPSGEEAPTVRLRVAGRHNLANAIAAFGAATLCGVTPSDACAGLERFTGAGRRMQYRGMLRGARLLDDYAHHPTEIRATLQAAREMVGRGRLIAVFQSHTYSRTAAFFTEICDALRTADRVLIAPIYPARERDTLGMSAALLADGVGQGAIAFESKEQIAAALEAEAGPGDLIVVMGAGDIDGIFRVFSRNHFTLS